ncbi:MCE family protein, partial [Legionella taurinensis]
SLFNQLDSVLKEVSENINSVSVEIKRIFDKKNAESLHNTLVNLEKFTGVLAENKQHIDRTLENTDIMVKNIAQVSKELPRLSQDLKISITHITRMADSISNAGDRVSLAMDSGKSTIDKISQQTIPPAIILLRRLNAIAANLEQVSNQMRQNPSVLIRGTKPLKPGPGE